MIPREILCLDSYIGTNFAFYRGDCVDVLRQFPSNSIDMSVFSPPFANVYTYSDSLRDMGNCDDDTTFLASYEHLVRELYRVTRPGRICVVHCKDLVYYRGSSERGTAGFRDFPGDLVRVHVRNGWDFHSRVTVWKSPVEEQRKTNAHGLLYKQLRADSTVSRQGCAEYLLVFRKFPTNDAEESMVVPVTHTREDFPLEQWQQWASPVWMDVDHTDVLNVKQARENGDEKHMCPLSLDIIERALKLWSNPGDVILSPFGGIGSEPSSALKFGRKAVAIELKDSYWRTGVENCREVDDPRQRSMFGK
jgi:DNA modification methylase